MGTLTSNTSFANPNLPGNTSRGSIMANTKKSASTQGTGVLSGIPAIDAMIAAFTKTITKNAADARKSILQSKKNLKLQNKQTKIESDLARAQLAALNVQPAPQVKSLSSPEVLMARRQVALDAGSRNGMRKSIIAGNNV